MPDDRSAPLSVRPSVRGQGVPDRREDGLTPIQMADPRYSRDPYEEDGGGFDFWGALRTVLRRKFMILAVMVLGTSAAALLTLRVTPLYQATATIEVQREETRIIESGSIDPVTIADSEYMATQYALLKSRALAERVVETLGLVDKAGFADQDLGRSERVQSAAASLAANLRIAPDGRSRVVRITMISPDPAEAALIANTLVDSFIEGSLERKFNTTAYARKFLEERLAAAKTALEDAERSLVDYAQAKDILELGPGSGSLDISSLVSLNQEFTIAQTNRIVAEQRYRENLGSEATQEALVSEDLKRLRQARAQLTAQYQEMLGTFKPDYPDVQKLQTRIDALDAEISEARAAIGIAAEAGYKAALAREQSLARRISELKGDVQDQRGRRIDYTILQREVDTARTQYEALLQRLKEVSIGGGVGSSQVSVVDRAVAPGAPFEPNLQRSLIQALILSLFVGIGLAFALNYIDDTVKTPEDVKQKLGLPAVGVIPRVKGREVQITDSLKDPRSPIAEAFFSARTALEFTTTTGAPRSLVVTSSKPNEGKTSSTISLGMSFARTGQKVLIIDGDMRKPSFVANPADSIGLSGLLTQDAVLSDNIVGSSTPGLWLLPSGVIPPNPAELLSSPRLAALIELAGEQFDIVIVDSPPLLGLADAPILASICEATVLVIESGAVRRPAALRSVERLMESNANVVGAMLTKFDASKSGYESGEYYYSYGKGAYAYGARKVAGNDRNRRKVRLFAEPGPYEDRPGGS